MARCALFQKVGDQWLQFASPVAAVVIAAGIMINDELTGCVLIEYPVDSLESVKFVSQLQVHIHTTGSTAIVALKFYSSSEADQFRITVPILGIPILGTAKSSSSDSHDSNGEENQEFLVPDINSPHVQEYIANLILSDEFKIFVNDLSKWMKED